MINPTTEMTEVNAILSFYVTGIRLVRDHRVLRAPLFRELCPT